MATTPSPACVIPSLVSSGTSVVSKSTNTDSLSVLSSKDGKDPNQAWEWFTEKAPMSLSSASSSSSVRQTVGLLLQHSSGASSKSCWDDLLEPTAMAQEMLQRALQTQVPEVAWVWMALLHAPSAFQTPWKAVQPLLQRLKQIDDIENNDLSIKALLALHFFFTETISGWTTKIDPSPDSTTQQMLRPSDFITTWIPILLDGLSLSKSGPNGSIDWSLQLLLTLVKLLSSRVASIDWVMNVIFDTKQNHYFEDPSVVTKLAPYMRLQDWDVCLEMLHNRQDSRRGNPTGKEDTENADYWVYHFLQWLLLVPESQAARMESVVFQELIHWMPAGQNGVLRIVATMFESKRISRWIQLLLLSRIPDDEKEEAATVTLLMLLESSTWTKFRMKSVWTRLDTIATRTNNNDDDPSEIETKNNIKKSRREDESFDLDSFLGMIVYTGNGSFIGRNPTVSHICTQMTSVGRIVSQLIKANPSPRDDEKHRAFDLLTTCHHAEISETVILGVVVTVLVEARSLRIPWIQSEVVIGLRQNLPRIQILLGALYMVHVFDAIQENKIQNKFNPDVQTWSEVDYNKLLQRLLVCASPTHHLVRALSPRASFRPILLQTVLTEWLSITAGHSYVRLWQNPNSTKDIGLWTLLHLVSYENDSGRKGKGENFCKPIYEFIIMGLPPVPARQRSWFWDQAMSDCIQQTGINHDVESMSVSHSKKGNKIHRVVDRLHRSLIIRFLQLMERCEDPTRGDESKQYIRLSLDRIFVHCNNKKFVAIEDVASMFSRLIRLMPFFYQQVTVGKHKHHDKFTHFVMVWVQELADLLDVPPFCHPSDLASNGASKAKHVVVSNCLDESSILCVRIVVHFVVGSAAGNGLEFNQSLKQLRRTLCGQKDELLIQCNADAQKQLTAGSISDTKIPECCLRFDLAGLLLQVLFSEEVHERIGNSSNRAIAVLRAVCGLTTLQQNLRQQMSEFRHRPQFHDPEERDMNFICETFPRFVSLSFTILSSLISTVPSVNNRDENVSTKVSLLVETNMIVRSILFFCREFQSIMAREQNKELTLNQPVDIVQSLSNLYDMFCSKKALGSFVTYLEHYIEIKGLDFHDLGAEHLEMKSGVAPFVSFGFNSTQADIDRSAREIRREILGTIEKFLNSITQESESGVICHFVNRMMGDCGRDLCGGLQSTSGGLDIKEFSSFLGCIEAACHSASVVISRLPSVEDIEELFQTCISVADIVEDIVCSVAIRHRSTLKRTLCLYLRVVPAVMDQMFRHALLGGVEINVSLECVTNQTHSLFDQCIQILKKLSASSGQTSTWGEIVDPGHLKASGQPGDTNTDDDNSDEDADSKNGGTLTLVQKESLSTGKQTCKKIQLASSRPWVWSLICVIDALGAAMEDSIMVMSKTRISFFPNLRMVDIYITHRVRIISEIIKSSKALLPKDLSVEYPLSSSLPPFPKSAFRFLLEKALKAASRAFDVLCTEIDQNQSRYDSAKAEALACALAWVSDMTPGPDLCVGVFFWSYLEGKVADRVKRANDVLVTDSNNMAKKLEKAILCAQDVHDAMQTLHAKLQENGGKQHVEETLQQWDQFATSCAHGNRGFFEMLDVRLTQSQQQLSDYRARLNLQPVSAGNRARLTIKRRRSTSDQPITRKGRKERITQSRNNIVRSWLELDRDIGRDETYQEDAYAELEDFLVEG